MTMRIIERRLDPKVNLSIHLLENGEARLHHQSHNIFLDNGRQFLAEAITASAFGPAVRYSNEVVQYMAFGIGGNRQTASAAGASPLADAWPGGYGGTNLQDDLTLSIAGLERPVQVSAGVWLKEITPGTPAEQFPDAKSVAYVATFSQADLNLGGTYAMVPLSEIGLYTSAANPSNPNGADGSYPGTPVSMIAYDTFEPIPKTGQFDIQVTWTLQF